MELFYLAKIRGHQAVLEGEEHHHISRVLRKKVGDEITFTDGQGMLYTGVIRILDKDHGIVDIKQREQVSDDKPFITVFTALTKNVKRMEWAFEKMTELGVRRIQPMVCKRSERDKINVRRAKKILISAMKQSERCSLPELGNVRELQEVLDSSDFSEDTTKYICHRSEESVLLNEHYKPLSDVVCLIGPEGDFTNSEIDAVREYGFCSLSLGEYRLRTETAGVAFVAALQALNCR